MQKESFFIAIFLLFLVAHLARRNFFWIYFWQKRGGRFRRFLNGIRENIRILFSKSAILALFFILIFPYLIRINYLFEGIVFVIYSVFGIYSLCLFFASLFTYDFGGHFFLAPKFNTKTIILFLFITSLETLFLVKIVLSRMINGDYYSLIWVLVLEVFFPFFFFLSSLFFNLLLFTEEKLMEGRAKKKIKDNKNLIVVGICGSYGKTLTKEFLFQLLSKKYKVLKTEGKDAEIGDIINLVRKKLKRSHDIFICEISAYRKGEVDRICNILKPKIGILTGISEDHLSLFGSLSNILNTKFELINCLPKDGVGIFNIENKNSQKLFQRTTIKKYSYSVSEEKGDIFARNVVQESLERISFDIVAPKGEERIILNFPGKENIENFLGAVVCALELGININRLKKIASEIKLPGGFMTKKTGKNNIKVIDDTASHTPNGFFSALDSLKQEKGKKILIASSLLELGKAASSIHNNIGKKIGEVCNFVIMVTPVFFKEIKLGAISAGMGENKILFLRSPRKILKQLNPYFKKSNVILLEGEISDKIKERIIS